MLVPTEADTTETYSSFIQPKILCHIVTKVEEVEVDLDIQSVPGGELDNEEEKRCVLDCPYLVHEDFHRN